ncbi:MAG: DinB family protein [Holophagales bacterium]|nr:DinB family protein [Holophagales bacterium]
MDSIDLIRENLERSEEIVLSRVEDMREHGMVLSTPNGGCHTVWVLGHLTFIESLVIQQFMLGEPNPFAEWEALFDGVEIPEDAEQYPQFDQILQLCRRVRASTIARLDAFAEDDLDTVSAQVPDGAEGLFGTYRRCFQYAADHWLMHRGQLADARHVAGVERMWY